jgi:hypothetical protein
MRSKELKFILVDLRAKTLPLRWLPAFLLWRLFQALSRILLG